MCDAKRSWLESLRPRVIWTSLSRWLSFTVHSWVLGPITNSASGITRAEVSTGIHALLVGRKDFVTKLGLWLLCSRGSKRVRLIPAFINADTCIFLASASETTPEFAENLALTLCKLSGPSSMWDGSREWLEVCCRKRINPSLSPPTNSTNFDTLLLTDSRTNSLWYGFDTPMKFGLLRGCSNERTFLIVVFMAEHLYSSGMLTKKPSTPSDSESCWCRRSVRASV